MKKRNYKRRLTALGVLLFILVALFAFLLFWFFGASYPHFKNAKKHAAIPGLDAGISPQGLCAVSSNAQGYEFAMSGYMVKSAPSRVYLIKEDGAKYVTVTQNGKALTTHFGGIACTENYLIVASGKSLVRLSLTDVLNAQDGAAVEAVDSFETGIQNAFCYYADGYLYAGEFYRDGNYKTDASHHLTENGETNYAFVYAYRADESKAGGVAENIPEKVISVRGLVQGIAVYEGGITLSTSYGLADSVLYTYENVLSGAAHGSADVNGTAVPLYRLDGTNMTGARTLPCMSEEIFVKDGRLYVLFESLCDKYKYFVRTQIDSIYSLPLEELTQK